MNRVWTLISSNQNDINLNYSIPANLPKEDDKLVRIVNIAIKGITNDIETDFQFNTVISKYRELVNSIADWRKSKGELNEDDKQVFSYAVAMLIKLMSPVTVHMSEEIWENLGGEGSIHDQPWCEYDENLAKLTDFTLVVQVNGKVRDKITVDESMSKEEMEQTALASERVKEYTNGKSIVKVIVVPKKLVNIVVK